MRDGALFAYFGHHKCGTQWMNAIVGEICLRVGRDRVIHNNPQTFGHDLASAIAEPDRTFLCYTNANRRFVDSVEPLRGFHMVRDPRDIIVSAYFSHLHSHPDHGTLAQFRERLRSVSKDKGLLLEMDRRVHQFRMMDRWDYGRDDVLELRMEDVTTDAHSAVSRIVSFLGLGPDHGLDRGTVAAIVDRHDFSVKAGRPPGTEDVTSHYRKGVPGDWVNHFSDEHVAYFKQRYNDLLLKLGYETSADWAPPTDDDPRPRALEPDLTEP